jgi:hypothetical protein
MLGASRSLCGYNRSEIDFAANGAVVLIVVRSPYSAV